MCNLAPFLRFGIPLAMYMDKSMNEKMTKEHSTMSNIKRTTYVVTVADDCNVFETVHTTTCKLEADLLAATLERSGKTTLTVEA